MDSMLVNIVNDVCVFHVKIMTLHRCNTMVCSLY